MPHSDQGAPPQPCDAWISGGLADLCVADDVAFRDVPGLPWAALRAGLEGATFTWPDAPSSPALSDVVRQANLLAWHPADAHELLNSGEVGADELCHMAVHRALFAALAQPEGWRGWLLCEACASAADLLVLGVLLRARREAEFVALQVEVLSECWRDAERDEADFEATLVALATDPVAAFRDLVRLLEGHVTDLRAANSVQATAEAFAAQLRTPWGPLLLHFQTAWWTAALRRLPDDTAAGQARVEAVRERVLTSASPLETVVALGRSAI